MVSEEQKNIANFLIEKFNDCVGCYCMASDDDKEKLVSVIEDMEIGKVTFNDGDFAEIVFRSHTIRADL